MYVVPAVQRKCLHKDCSKSQAISFSLSVSPPVFNLSLPVASSPPPPIPAMDGGAEAAVLNPATGSPYSKRYLKLLEKRRRLPIWGLRQKFVETLKQLQVVVVAAENGSGKSTQIPQFVVDAGYASSGKQIACTQPRRLVVTSLSRRVAQEMDVKIGEEVGYSVKFEDCSGPKTILKYITDGTLLRETLSDRSLERYTVIIVDEAHLRTLATDVLCGYLKKVTNARPDLKLVIMSTVIEAKKFRDYFNGARIVQVTSTPHPIEIIHTKDPVRDYVETAIEKVMQIISSEPSGDILVFLTGGEEIEICCSRLSKAITQMGDEVGPVKIVPLHSNLSLDMQEKVFKGAPPSKKKGGPVGRKVVFSTDISESSLVIDGIVFVIDSGFTKQKVYNPCQRVEALLFVPISKATAQMRSACAKRSAPGKCFRLYTKKFYDAAQQQVSPEVLRANLASTILHLKRLGIDNMLDLKFMDPPATETVTQALETLSCLGALDGEGKLTKLGEQMAEFPLDPQMSKMIISSPKFRCSNEILSIAAMLSVQNCFLRPTDNQLAADEVKSRLSHINGDHLTLLNVYQAYKKHSGDSSWCEQNFIDQSVLKSAESLRNQLVAIMHKLNQELCSTEVNHCDYYSNIRKGILAGYFMQAARLGHSDCYFTLKVNHSVELHPSSCLSSKPAWVVYNDFVLASKNFIRIVTDVCGEWLVDIAPHYYRITSLS